MKAIQRTLINTTLVLVTIAFVTGVAYISFEVGRMVGDGEGWREAVEATNLPSVSEINNLARVCSQI